MNCRVEMNDAFGRPQTTLCKTSRHGALLCIIRWLLYSTAGGREVDDDVYCKYLEYFLQKCLFKESRNVRMCLIATVCTHTLLLFYLLCDTCAVTLKCLQETPSLLLLCLPVQAPRGQRPSHYQASLYESAHVGHALYMHAQPASHA